MDEVVALARAAHGDRYDYSGTTIVDNGKGRPRSITYTCPRHGHVVQGLDHHLNAKGCDRCRTKPGLEDSASFVEAARAVHGDRYDYSQATLVRTEEGLPIAIYRCPVHGTVEQSAYVHLKGRGCVGCASDSMRLSIDDFRERIRVKFSDVEFTIDGEWKGSGTDVRFDCPTHGPQHYKAGALLSRRSPCRGCSRRGAVPSSGGVEASPRTTSRPNSRRRMAGSWDSFLEAASLKFGERYAFSCDDWVGVTSSLVVLSCERHGDTTMLARSVLRQTGCPRCSVEARAEARTRTMAQFVERASEVHGYRYRYEGHVDDARVPEIVRIICTTHGAFEQSSRAHLGGQGCQKCAGAYRRTAAEFIEEATEIHEGRYDYAKVAFVNTATKVVITCPDHGDFEMTPGAHLSHGYGCATCANESRRKTGAEFIRDAIARFCQAFDYSNVVYSGPHVPVRIECARHGPFMMTPYRHMASKVGCLYCAGVGSESELRWLTSLGVQWYQRQVKIDVGGIVMRVDGFDEITRTVYEFWGDFWHGNPHTVDVAKYDRIPLEEMYQRTMQRRQRIIDAGYRLVEIWESEFLRQERDERRAMRCLSSAE